MKVKTGSLENLLKDIKKLQLIPVDLTLTLCCTYPHTHRRTCAQSTDGHFIYSQSH